MSGWFIIRAFRLVTDDETRDDSETTAGAADGLGRGEVNRLCGAAGDNGRGASLVLARDSGCRRHRVGVVGEVYGSAAPPATMREPVEESVIINDSPTGLSVRVQVYSEAETNRTLVT